jgi:hypothetical protein
MTKRVAYSVRFLVELLVAGKYARLYELDREKQLSAELLSAAVAEYGGHLTLPPPPFPRIDLYQQASSPHRRFLDVRLWVNGEESDLTLQCTLFTNEVQEERYPFAITDLLVM